LFSWLVVYQKQLYAELESNRRAVACEQKFCLNYLLIPTADKNYV